jgi:hypothetical protein
LRQIPLFLYTYDTGNEEEETYLLAGERTLRQIPKIPLFSCTRTPVRERTRVFRAGKPLRLVFTFLFFTKIISHLVEGEDTASGRDTACCLRPISFFYTHTHTKIDTW